MSAHWPSDSKPEQTRVVIHQCFKTAPGTDKEGYDRAEDKRDDPSYASRRFKGKKQVRKRNAQISFERLRTKQTGWPQRIRSVRNLRTAQVSEGP